MSDNVYSVSEIAGSSAESIDDAIRGAVARASKTLKAPPAANPPGLKTLRMHIE